MLEKANKNALFFLQIFTGFSIEYMFSVTQCIYTVLTLSPRRPPCNVLPGPPVLSNRYSLALRPVTKPMVPTNLPLPLCLFLIACPTDFHGLVELLSFLAPQTTVTSRGLGLGSTFSVAPVITIERSDPVQVSSSPKLLPDRTYESIQEGKQFDIIFVPEGNLKSFFPI
jgi:hypothetical protein